MKIVKTCKYILLAALFLMLNPLNYVQAVTLTPQMFIDEPSVTMINNTDINVRGWAIDSSGINNVNIYFDNNLLGNATIGQARPDIIKVFPNYPEADTSGYSYVIDVNKVNAGIHNLKVEAVGKDGTKQYREKSIQIVKPLSRMYLDDPAQYIQTQDILIRGWALEPSGVSGAKVYVDEILKGNAQINTSRPDVNKAFPGYPDGDNCGFTYTLDINGISPGVHNLKVLVTGKDGHSQTVQKSVEVRKPEQKIWLDEPSGYLQQQDFLIRGWALNPSGVSKVNVYVDSALNGSANYGQARPDVNKVFTGYPSGDNSGFSYTLDVNPIPDGIHRIMVEAVGNDGTSKFAQKTIEIRKPAPRAYVDDPASGNFTKDILLRGWALNYSGVKDVDVSIDGVYKGKSQYGLDRPDIKAAFPIYPNADKSGFQYTISNVGLASGNHKITLNINGIDGSTQTVEKYFGFTKLPNRMYVDEPSVSSFNNTDINVKGWALFSSGIQNVKIYLNDQLSGTAQIVSRPDVRSAYPGYKDEENVGFQYNIDVDTVKPGTYNLRIAAISNSGEIQNVQKTIVIKKPAPHSWVDEPSQVVNTDQLTVRGWAVNASGVKQVKVIMDNNYLGDAQFGSSRPDVSTVYPGYVDGDNCGFTYTMSTTSMKTGWHTINVISIGNDGTQTLDTPQFVFKGIYNYIQYSNTLDYYVNQQMTQSQPVVYGPPEAPATADQVRSYMDPSKYIDDPQGKYMFMKLTYVDGVTAQQLDAVLKGKGILDGKGAVFLKAAKDNNVNPIYLVAHAMHETGWGTSALANGVLVSQLHKTITDSSGKTQIVVDQDVTPRTTFNMYGIGAYDSNAVMWGSETAYKQGWFDVDTAIIGGARWIAQGYIASTTYKQDTLYKMRWNFNVIYHQYATDIGWAYKQTKKIKEIVDMMDNPVIYYDIPVFKQ